VLVADVEGELSTLDPVELGRLVAVEHRWAAARRHPNLEGEQGAAAVGARHAEAELVGPDGEQVLVTCGCGFQRRSPSLDVGKTGFLSYGVR
jgi:hypothetical protein